MIVDYINDISDLCDSSLLSDILDAAVNLKLDQFSQKETRQLLYLSNLQCN